MGIELTAENFAELEQHQGVGMVVPLSVGDTDFAFRRPTELDVDLVLASKEAGQLSYLEECAIRCLLCSEAPAAGKSADEDKALGERAHAALVAERMRLKGLWQRAPLLRDWLPLGFAEACGWSLELSPSALGGGRYAISAKSNSRSPSGAGVSVTLTARVFREAEYSEFRRQSMLSPQGVAERYAWRVLVDAPNKAELARLYPFLVISAGQFMQTLGSEGLTVRPKAFGSGRAQLPGSSTEPLASAETSE